MRTVILLLVATLLCRIPVSAQQMDSIPSAHGYLYYHIYGAGTPVIMLTGGPGNSYLQQEEVAITLGSVYKGILLEQRGTGRSIPTPFDSTTINLHNAIEDVKLLLDHLHVPKAIIYGHSWGGMLAMCFAATYPGRVKALVLASPGYYRIGNDIFAVHIANQRARYGLAELDQLDSLQARMTGKRANAADTMNADRLNRLTYIYDKRLLDSMLKKINAGPHYAQMRILMINDLFRVHYDLRSYPLLARYKGPLHIISGSQDALAFYTYELKIIHPAAQLHWIQESGHFPMFEQAKAFNDSLFTVLKQVQ
ncbi:alpha/beta hydrolase [Chitinophaga agrisoli]|uniref:Alpha/beta hydrolase n=1 Tax=Chitinophaga agrisoli TaxID=2607653 RepID=A0A5B2VLF8_9BACT|nr:alpha/beta hydrolase [Chitinophaga agrisoli]KAA2239326.1 alpha/beta hydrolase [Chitinophaga agrisoli]